jgi:hypothetical protein
MNRPTELQLMMDSRSITSGYTCVPTCWLPQLLRNQNRGGRGTWPNLEDIHLAGFGQLSRVSSCAEGFGHRRVRTSALPEPPSNGQASHTGFSSLSKVEECGALGKLWGSHLTVCGKMSHLF